MRRTRNLSVEDAERVYDCFKSAQVSEGSERSSGFYNYPLTQRDIEMRLQDPRLCLGLELGKKRKLAAYILSYPAYLIRDMDVAGDDVLSRVEVPQETIYSDQLFLRQGLPVNLAGELSDILIKQATALTRQGAFCAIPIHPWKNQQSLQFALTRGFGIAGILRTPGLDFAVLTNPLPELGDEYGDVKIRLDSRNL